MQVAAHAFRDCPAENHPGYSATVIVQRGEDSERQLCVAVLLALVVASASPGFNSEAFHRRHLTANR